MTHGIRPMTSAEQSERIRRELAVPEDAGRYERPTVREALAERPVGRTEGVQFGAQRKYADRNPGPSAATDAGRYLRARLILKDLREKRLHNEITFQQYSTLRGQAIAGDVDGAVKGLSKVLQRNREQAEAGGETE